jgi:hypothetical protein
LAVAAGAEFVGAPFGEVADALFDVIADLAYLPERLPGGIVDVPVLDAADHVGAAALAVERDRVSACSCISSSIFFGMRSEMSIPTSRIASTTFGQIHPPAPAPAVSARRSFGAYVPVTTVCDRC